MIGIAIVVIHCREKIEDKRREEHNIAEHSEPIQRRTRKRKRERESE